jgi:hypothetical protein
MRRSQKAANITNRKAPTCDKKIAVRVRGGDRGVWPMVGGSFLPE